MRLHLLYDSELDDMSFVRLFPFMRMRKGVPFDLTQKKRLNKESQKMRVSLTFHKFVLIYFFLPFPQMCIICLNIIYNT